MMGNFPFTRTTRTVRITSADKKYFADVEILLAVSLQLPNQFEISYNITAPVQPLVIDTAGDGNDQPGGKKSTRSSHMQRVAGVPGTSWATACLDVEVCDAFTVTGPNNTEHLINCPSGNAIPQIIDDTDYTGGNANTPPSTGSGLGTVPPSNTQTRCQHVVRYTQQIPGATSAPFDRPNNYTYGILTDCMSFNGPPWGMPYVSESAPSTTVELPMQIEVDDNNAPQWGDIFGIVFAAPDIVIHGALQPSALCIDKTAYIADPDNPDGPSIPPPPDPNLDLNIYVYWPGIGNADPVPGAAPQGNPTSGPFLGPATPIATVQQAIATAKANNQPPPAMGYSGIDMGPIWWIRQLGIASPNVWYWFISPIQQPLCWSGFGTPPENASPTWGYRGAYLLPFFPVIWILSENYPLTPLGTYGAPDIVTAAGGYIIDGGITVNWAGLGIPDFPATYGVSTVRQDIGGLGVGLPIEKYTSYSYYMPFGAFDLLGPKANELLHYAGTTAGAGGDSGSGRHSRTSEQFQLRVERFINGDPGCRHNILQTAKRRGIRRLQFTLTTVAQHRTFGS